MRWSKLFIPTLRENPRDVEEKSHRLLLRGGYIRPLGAGFYNYLFLAQRILAKISKVIREEMDKIGGQELLLSQLSPKLVWELSKRWKEYGDDMFRLKDRKGQELALSPTHEEIITFIASKEIHSYKELPQIWYQIQTKFRDELRPRSGLLRSRQFLMKDSYSLDIDFNGLNHSYELHKEAYEKIFRRLCLDFFIVEASGGLMGEGESAEFMVECEAGEDKALICPSCKYSANSLIAESVPKPIKDEDEKPVERVHTPGKKSVEEIVDFLGVPHQKIVKSMLFIRQQKPLMILIRGDYELSEEKLFKMFGKDIRFAIHEDAQKYIGASLGFIGPYGIKNIEIYADETLKGFKNGVTGANKDDYHITGLNLERDVKINSYIDVHKAKVGDLCKRCNTPLEEKKCIEVGHIFKLGTKYSVPMKAMVLNRQGKETPVVMGSYGIGLERVMATVVERNSDENVLRWPPIIAPFDAEIVSIGKQDFASKLYHELKNKGMEVLYDDRDVQPGVKFADADLVGIPIRVIVGPKGMEKKKIDIKLLRTNDQLEVSLEDSVAYIQKLWEQGKSDG